MLAIFGCIVGALLGKRVSPIDGSVLGKSVGPIDGSGEGLALSRLGELVGCC